MLTTLEVCYEFYLRGFTFAAHGPVPVPCHPNFSVDEEHKALLPPFVSVSGLGETAAWYILEGRKGKRFISIEEVSVACPKVSKTHIEQPEGGWRLRGPARHQPGQPLLAPYRAKCRSPLEFRFRGGYGCLECTDAAAPVWKLETSRMRGDWGRLLADHPPAGTPSYGIKWLECKEALPGSRGVLPAFPGPKAQRYTAR